MSNRLGVGIVGCGEATQILHLPALDQLGERFCVRGLCDASRTVLDGVGASRPDAFRTTEPDELLARSDVDVVLVANPNAHHAEVAVAAARAGKHVLIEKPMCMTLAEADALEAAERDSGKVLQIGYMRRHAPAFEQAVAEVRELDHVSLARVHAVIGPNSAFISNTSNVIRGDDIPEADRDRTDRLTAARIEEAVGTADPDAAGVYTLLLGLSCHDLSAMRELIGMPKGVIYARAHMDPLVLTAAFDYGGFVCHFETTIDRIARFDSYLKVFGPTKVVKVQYDTPYIRSQPTRLEVTEADDVHGLSERFGHPSRRDSFTIEWERLHDHIATGSRPKTGVADARQDLILSRWIMEALGW